MSRKLNKTQKIQLMGVYFMLTNHIRSLPTIKSTYLLTIYSLHTYSLPTYSLHTYSFPTYSLPIFNTIDLRTLLD